jgi:hypothetical protein
MDVNAFSLFEHDRERMVIMCAVLFFQQEQTS